MFNIRICTRAADFLFYDDNRYTKCASIPGFIKFDFDSDGVLILLYYHHHHPRCVYMTQGQFNEDATKSKPLGAVLNIA